MMTTALLTSKRVARVVSLPLSAGGQLVDCPIGYETYGRLAPAGDNAVLVCHFFSGSSHAAGRYTPDDAAAGWWDAVIGPGKAIDTDRWFVVAIDALGCVRVDAPHGVTASPAMLDPMTGQRYGPDFPAIAIADMVTAQRLVLDQLKVGKLAAVVGPSLGAMQALEWAVRRPHDVARVVAAIGLTGMHQREHALYHAMAAAIRLDPLFNGGRYAQSAPPVTGVAIAVELMLTLSGGTAIAGAPPRDAVDEFEAWLSRETLSRAKACDANALIAMLRTNTRWRLGDMPLEQAAAAIRARMLLLPSEDDGLLPPTTYHTPFAEALQRAGADVTVDWLPAGYGHLGGLFNIAHAAPAIRACLEMPIG